MRVCGRNALRMRRAALQDIPIDRRGLQRVHLRRHVALERGPSLKSVNRIRAVDFRKMILMDSLRQMPTAVRMVRESTAESHEGLLIVVASIVIHLFPLQLVLDALAVGCVADQWQHRANSLHKHRTLSGLRVIQGRLHILSISTRLGLTTRRTWTQ
jgi:hypothetical protein